MINAIRHDPFYGDIQIIMFSVCITNNQYSHI
jgi:hypothetical protein